MVVHAMNPVEAFDIDIINRVRAIWTVRPELRAVYYEWFEELLRSAEGLRPVVEIGSGPGFFKEHSPHLIATDLIRSPWIDVVCDAAGLPFKSGAVGAVVMVDVLHHLPKPLDFMGEVARVLRPGGHLAMIEPWITPFSFVLWRFFHHEDCHLCIDLACPFNGTKKAFDGNSAIPFKLLRDFQGGRKAPLQLLRAEAFLGLPYLVTLGFKLSRPIPFWCVRVARRFERLLVPLRRVLATRILLVWESPRNG